MAKDDLDSARGNLKIGKYYVCVYLCHQAVEKAFKALLLKKSKLLIKTHDLVILGRKNKIPNKLLKKCEQLSRVYIETKYGVLGDYIPSKKFKKKNSLDYLSIAKEVVAWVSQNI